MNAAKEDLMVNSGHKHLDALGTQMAQDRLLVGAVFFTHPTSLSSRTFEG